MNNATITITTDQKIKQEAEEAAKTLGTSVERLLLDYLLEFLEAKKDVPESLKESWSYRLTPTPYLKPLLRQLEKNQKEGKSSPSFENAKDAIAFLHSQTE